jgi:hypothetical protein
VRQTEANFGIGTLEHDAEIACPGRVRDAIRGGYRFPACATPLAPVVVLA